MTSNKILKLYNTFLGIFGFEDISEEEEQFLLNMSKRAVTVKSLKAALKDLPDDMPVIIQCLIDGSEIQDGPAIEIGKMEHVDVYDKSHDVFYLLTVNNQETLDQHISDREGI